MKFLSLLLLPLFTLAPARAQDFERDTPRLHAYDFVTSQQFEGPLVWRYGGDQERKLYYRGFSFTNFGPNDIIYDPPTDFLNTPSREFFFMSDDQSRRDTYLWVTDYNGSGRSSDFFETVMVFLPRLNPMRVVDGDEYLTVTLPTTEKVQVFKKYRTLESQILTEEMVDLNPDRNQRKFPGIFYHGEGLVIRSDAKGRDPRLASTVQILKKNQAPCLLPGKLFWTQEDYPKFKFVSDQDAFELIEKECGKGYVVPIGL